MHRTTGRFCNAAIGFTVLLSCCVGRMVAAAAVAAASERPAAQSPAARAKLDEVVANVRRNEDLFRNLDVTLRTSWKFHPQSPAADGGVSFGASVLDTIVETHRQATQGDRLYFSSDETISPVTGANFKGQSTAVCDGSQTFRHQSRTINRKPAPVAAPCAARSGL